MEVHLSSSDYFSTLHGRYSRERQQMLAAAYLCWKPHSNHPRKLLKHNARVRPQIALIFHSVSSRMFALKWLSFRLTPFCFGSFRSVGKHLSTMSRGCGWAIEQKANASEASVSADDSLAPW